MVARIEDIENTGRALRARRVRFDDGTERVTAASAAKALSLESGMSLSPVQLEAALQQVEPALARDRALRLLGYRERSVAELASRLRDDGFPESLASSIVGSLQESGLVDDARFAEHLICTRAAAGYGRQRILRELIQSGLDRPTAESYIEASGIDADEVARLRSVVAAHPPKNRRERDRLLNRLVAKGFAAGAVLDAIRYPDDSDADITDDHPLP